MSLLCIQIYTYHIFDRVAAEYDAFRLPTPRFVPETLIDLLDRCENVNNILYLGIFPFVVDKLYDR